jgi:hypothetical protein
MSAASQDVSIDQGTTYELLLTWQDSTGAPVNMTGYRVHSQFKAHQTNVVVINADTAVTTPGVTINTPGPTGVIDIVVSPSITSLLSGMGLYDLVATSPAGVVDRLIQGSWVVSNAVTSG